MASYSEHRFHNSGSRDVAISATDGDCRVRCGMNKLAILALAIVASCCTSLAQARDKKYGPGVTEQEIKLGQTGPYSGPVSAAPALGRVPSPYLEKGKRERGTGNAPEIQA